MSNKLVCSLLPPVLGLLMLGFSACGASGAATSAESSPAAVSGSGVTVDVVTTNTWSDGFNGAVRVTNNSYSASITSFEVVFALSGTATISGSAWNGHLLRRHHQQLESQRPVHHLG